MLFSGDELDFSIRLSQLLGEFGRTSKQVKKFIIKNLKSCTLKTHVCLHRNILERNFQTCTNYCIIVFTQSSKLPACYNNFSLTFCLSTGRHQLNQCMGRYVYYFFPKKLEILATHLVDFQSSGKKTEQNYFFSCSFLTQNGLFRTSDARTYGKTKP